MSWFTTVDHKGQAVEIDSVAAMNAVVAAYEARLDQLGVLLGASDRDTRRRAADEYKVMAAKRDRIEADVARAEALGELASEDAYHRALAKAIRERPAS